MMTVCIAHCVYPDRRKNPGFAVSTTPTHRVAGVSRSWLTLLRFFWLAYAWVLSFLMPRNRRTLSPTLSMPISFRTSLSISSKFSPLIWFFLNKFS